MTEQPQSGFRTDAIYVEWLTRRGFFYVPRDPDQTVDGLINQVLADWLKQNHPKVVEHLKALQIEDKTFRDEYSQRKEPQ